MKLQVLVEKETLVRAAVFCIVYLLAASICMAAACAKAPTAKAPAKMGARSGAKALGGKSTNAIEVNDEKYNRPVTDKWALIIGISKFQDSSLNLNYAAKDAIDFANFLTTRMRFQPDHIKILTDEDATRENILDALGDKWLPRVSGKDDMIVIYLSTHGSPSAMDIGKVNYIVAHDTDKDRLYSTGVAMQDLCRIIKDRIQSNRALLVLDACHSGAAVPKEAKGMARSGNIDVDEISQGTGHMVLSSSAPSQVAWESVSKPNSVFTRRLMEGFQINGPDTTLEQAYAHLQKSVEQEVQRDRGYLQTPQLKGKWSGQKLVLGARPSDPRPGLRDTGSSVKLASAPSSPIVRPQPVEAPPISTLSTPIPRVGPAAALPAVATSTPASTTPQQTPTAIVYQPANAATTSGEVVAMATPSNRPRVTQNAPTNDVKTLSATPSAPVSPTSSATTIVFSAPPRGDGEDSGSSSSDQKGKAGRSKAIAVLPFDGPFEVNTDVSIGFKMRTGGMSPPSKGELSVLPESLRNRLQSKLHEILPGMYADISGKEVEKALEESRSLKAMGSEYWNKLGKLLGTKYILAGSIDEVDFDGNLISGDDYTIKVTAKLISADSGKILWKRMKSFSKKIHTGKKDPLDYFLGSVSEETAEQIVQNIQKSSFKE